MRPSLVKPKYAACLGALVGFFLVGCDKPAPSARSESASVQVGPPMAKSAPIIPDGGAEPGFALLELFTSEGCSSCPPADENLERVTEQAARTGRRVFTLSFHVDYWNDLGWSDPYSDGRFSERQRDYLGVFKRPGAYTPELVINGREEFVGSDVTMTRDGIIRGLSRDARARVDVTGRREGDTIVISYDVRAAQKSLLLELALFQDRARSSVTAGENRGRVIEHRNVVRDFVISGVTAPTRGDRRFAIPDGVAPKSMGILAFVSDPGTREVLGVGEFPPESS